MNQQKIFPRHAIGAAITALALGMGGLTATLPAQGQSVMPSSQAPQGNAQSSGGEAPAASPAPSADQPAGEAPFITEQKSSQTLASSIMGMSIHNGTGKDAKDIGKVTDLILDKDHKLTGVVVGVGGFLGIGQKDVGIPWSKVQDIDPEAQVAIVDMSKEALEKAPPFTSIEEKKAQEKQEQEKMKAQQSQPSGGGGMAPMSAPAPAGS